MAVEPRAIARTRPPEGRTRPATASPEHLRRRQRRVLVATGVALALAVAAYLLLDITGSWEYALRLRGRRVAAMALVGAAIGCSTVVFQTVTHNRILTPSIMGFDSLYVLVQTLAVFLLGAVSVAGIPTGARFAVEVVVMIAFAGLLHRALFDRRARDLTVLVLAGVVCGTLFSSLTSLVNRLIDPNEFIVLQDRLFASFGSVDTDLLGLSALLVAAATAVAWRARRALDVVALGRDAAVSLGVPYRRVVNQQLVLVAVLVSVATALVGPITFFGLLVANLARQLGGTFAHRFTIPAAALLGMLALVAGQLLLERLFAFDTSLSIIINFVGGVYFIALLLREARR